MQLFVALVVWALRASRRSVPDLVLENLALRQQLAACARAGKRPSLKPSERSFWVALSKTWTRWRSPLLIVEPATVIAWHRRAFRAYRRWRSGRPGRPRIDAAHIALIRQISADHPDWGEDRIAEELTLKLGVRHAASTIRRYMVNRPRPTDGQTWRTFVRNHAAQIYSSDFVTQYTALFAVVYVFVVMEIASPHIERFSRTLRQEARSHFLFLSARHVLRVCREFVRYYNGARPSQATHAIPDPYPELRTPPTDRGKVVALPVLGGIAHDYRRAA